MRRAALLALAALAAWPAAAPAGVQPGSPPAICGGSAFADVVGTSADDRLASPGPAQRIFGLRGTDRLTGSRTRATCLFGGPDDDLLNLEAGGGVAWGEAGRDVILGSAVGDIADGGSGVDAIATGAGDDKISVRDGRPEVVSCGEGGDIVRGDRADILIACESATLTGVPGPKLTPTPRVVDITGTVRFRFKAPRSARAGAYRVLYLTEAAGRRCGGGVRVLASFPKPYSVVRRGQRLRVAVPRPDLGWCRGLARVAVVREPGQGRPSVPVARFSFTVR